MTWASRRQAFVIGLLALVLVGIAVVVAAAVIGSAPPPSCADGLHNQDEEGVDCGGSCAYLCSADAAPPSISFARAVASGSRTDVVAYVANRNSSAAVRGARYVIELYGADRGFIASREGAIDLPPGSLVPIFAPGIHAGSEPAQAFVTFDDASLRWYREERRVEPPRIEAATVEEGASPRASAQVRNPTAYRMEDVALVATVFDEGGTPIAASQTLIRELPAGGAATASFFWNEPFPAPVGRVEVRPVPVLP